MLMLTKTVHLSTASFDDTDDDFDFDAYCEANPDFDAAINGHWEYA